jgi:hypothetical protein
MVNRTRQGDTGLTVGGVALISLNPDISIQMEHHNKKGMLTARVASRLGHFQPFAVIGLYNPPVGSTFNTGGRHWSDEIITELHTVLIQLRPRYGNNVVVLGDFNMRLGRYQGRTTSDFDKNRARSDDFKDLIRTTGLAPVHGRLSVPGTATSRGFGTNGGEAEVDYILANLGDNLQPIPHLTWEGLHITATSGVHLPIGASLQLTHQPTNHPRPEQAHPAPSRAPHYLHECWMDGAVQELQTSLEAVVARIRDRPDIPSEEVFTSTVQHLQEAQAAIFPPARPARLVGVPLGGQLIARTGQALSSQQTY